MAFVIKLKDERYDKEYFLEWSPIVNAPVDRGLDLEGFTKVLLKATDDEQWTHKRINRAIKSGTSCVDQTLHELIEGNCARLDGGHATVEEILDIYCRPSVLIYKCTTIKNDCIIAAYRSVRELLDAFLLKGIVVSLTSVIGVADSSIKEGIIYSSINIEK